MKNNYFLKTALYLGVILLIFLIAVYFNSLRVVSSDGLKTIRIARIRFNLDAFESQIKDAIYSKPKNKAFNQKQLRELDDLLISLEQQIEGQKLPRPDAIRKQWEQIKYQTTPNTEEMMHELDLLHKAINKKSLDDIIKREMMAEKDLTGLNTMKITIALLVFMMIIMAMYIDTFQTKQRKMLLKRLEELERKKLGTMTNTISKDILNELSDRIGHETMANIIQSYLLELPKTEKSLEQLLVEKNIDELHKVAERNISASETVGANGLANLFKELEHVDKIETAIELNSKINQEAKEVITKLQEQFIQPS